jgi:hypothetical protein
VPAGCCISYQNHARLVSEVLAELSILVEKITHISRVFAAQLLTSMGLNIQDVQRAGGWLKDCLGTAYIVISLSPESLLALAMWRKDGNDFQCFGDPRFHIAVPDELLFHALPALKKFREKADALATAALAVGAAAELKKPALMASQLARVLTVAMVARVQDAIATADLYPDNPFNADMMQHPLFRCVSCFLSAQATLLLAMLNENLTGPTDTLWSGMCGTVRCLAVQWLSCHLWLFAAAIANVALYCSGVFLMLLCCCFCCCCLITAAAAS